jgi:hypothetical protein
LERKVQTFQKYCFVKVSATVPDAVASTVSAKESNGLCFRAQFGPFKKQVEPVFITLLFKAWWSAGKCAKQ